jgi:linearmycin/streptolysin S transport system permease protein
MRRVIALALKDLVVLVRVKSGLFFTFVWPIIVAVLFGYVFSGQGQGAGRSTIPIAVVDEDQTGGSRAYIARLEQSGDFTIDHQSRSDAENLIRRGQRAAFVVIKPGFGERSQRMFYGEPREIEIGNDPARQAEAGMIEGLLTKYAMEDMQKLFTQPEQSRKSVGEALEQLKRTPDGSAQLAPLTRFLGELDTFLGTPLPPAPDGQGTGNWQPLKITKTGVTRQSRGPTNGFEVTFPQGVVWGII